MWIKLNGLIWVAGAGGTGLGWGWIFIIKMGLWVITRELAAQRKIRLHIDVFYIATAGRKIRKKVLVNSRQELDLNIRQDSQLSETLYIDWLLSVWLHTLENMWRSGKNPQRQFIMWMPGSWAASAFIYILWAQFLFLFKDMVSLI